MQFKNVAISLFVAVAAASDDVTTLLTQVPDCALTCLITGASDIGCTVTDYTCQCSKAAELQASAGPCIDSACSTADQESTSSFPFPPSCLAGLLPPDFLVLEIERLTLHLF